MDSCIYYTVRVQQIHSTAHVMSQEKAIHKSNPSTRTWFNRAIEIKPKTSASNLIQAAISLLVFTCTNT